MRIQGITLASIQLQEVMLSNCDNLVNIQLPGVENAALHGGKPQASLVQARPFAILCMCICMPYRWFEAARR